MLVLKFGGSSVGSVQGLSNLKYIVENKNQDSIVVVSAMSGVTDQLCKAFEIAFSKGLGYQGIISKMRDSHLDIIKSIVPLKSQHSCSEDVNEMLDKLENVLDCIAVLKESGSRSKDFVLSFGELLSSRIVVALLDGAEFIDARDIIVTDDNFGSANILWNESVEKIKDKCSQAKGVNVVNGFCGKTKDGYSATLGRGGSDLSASLIAAALDIECLEIWTDVNGMMTANPAIVSDALTIPVMKYNEAAEMSHFGAKVLYTQSLWPVVNKNIPVLIKNTFNPGHEGSLISAVGNSNMDEVVKGVSSISGMSLITISGNGLMGDIGVANKIFSLLADNEINIVLISQGSSEYSISFAISGEDADKAVALINCRFADEFSKGKFSGLLRQDNMAIVAVVGDNMRNVPGISGKVFSVLGKNAVNINAIAQGASEANISFVVSMEDENKAIRLLHDKFFLGGKVNLDIYLVGVGVVGSELIKQIDAQKAYIKDRYKVDISLKGIINSRKMLVKQECLLEDFDENWMDAAEISDLKEFVGRVKEGEAYNKILVDCSGSSAVADAYSFLLAEGVSVVTANKIAAASKYSNFENLLGLASMNGCSFRFETNVGAGLPVLHTIEDMVKSGDRVDSIKAVLSGSLNYIFNQLSEGVGLYEAVCNAEEKGFTEPDPRIDLSGLDVKRKLLIMSRIAGYRFEDSDISQEFFIPEYMLKGECIDTFKEELRKYEKEFSQKYSHVFEKGNKLRFAASLENGKASLGLMEVDKNHPFYELEDSNNIVMIGSQRYNEHPLTIKGYGAGAAVTAAGVFADIMKCIVEN